MCELCAVFVRGLVFFTSGMVVGCLLTKGDMYACCVMCNSFERLSNWWGSEATLLNCMCLLSVEILGDSVGCV